MRRPRARSTFPALLLTIAVFGAARGDEEAADDEDLDLEDLEDSPGEGAGPDAGPVEDFDLGMPEEDRQKRMNACYIHMMNRVYVRKSELDEAVKNVMTEQKAKIEKEQAAQLTEEKVLNSIAFSWMMSCYMNIDSAGIVEAIRGKAISQQLEQELFSQRADRPQQVPQASQRQWALLEQVMRTKNQEEMADMKQRESQQKSSSSSSGRQSGTGGTPAPQPPAYSGGGPLLSGMSGQSQAIYVLVVFGVIFGISGLGVVWLMQSEKESRDRSNKKAEKAGKKASRKSK